MKQNTSSHRRSLLKGLCWEIISTILTFGIAWLMFGHVAECILFAIICFVVKCVLYYAHERIWHQIPYGKRCPCVKQKEAEAEAKAEAEAETERPRTYPQ